MAKTIDQRMDEWAVLSEAWKDGYNYWYDEATPDPDENPFDIDSQDNTDWYAGFYYAEAEYVPYSDSMAEGPDDGEDEDDEDDEEQEDGN